MGSLSGYKLAGVPFIPLVTPNHATIVTSFTGGRATLPHKEKMIQKEFSSPLPRKGEDGDRCFCGKPYKNHPHCPLCGILAGRGHIESKLVKLLILPGENEVKVCKGCKEWAKNNTSKSINRFLQRKWWERDEIEIREEVKVLLFL